MDKKEVLVKVSKKSGINLAVCKKVLEVFEEVLEDDKLPESQKSSSAFNKVYNTLNFFRS